MGRAIYLWLLGCLALAAAIPLPGPTSEQDIINMILNAKPEDNDIDFTPTVTETQEVALPAQNTDELKEQELSQPEDPQDIPEESKAQDVPEKEQEKPESESLQKTSQVLPVDQKDQPDSDPAKDAEAEKAEESVPVTDEDQILTELDKPEGAQTDEDQLLTEQEVAEEPQPDEDETPVILVANDQIIPLDPQEAPIIIVQETQNSPNEEDMLPGEELPFSQDGEEQVFPVNEEEEFPINTDEEQIIVVSEDGSAFNLDTNDQEEVLVPVTVVELEEDELSLPILSETLIPGLSYEEPQRNVDAPAFEVSNFGESSFTNEESDSPAYFDTVNIPEPVQIENFQTTEDDGALSEVPIRETEAFIPVVPGNEESFSQLFADPIFRSSPPVYPSEDNYPPSDEMIGVYYIPESSFPVEDSRYENPEMKSNFFVNQAEAVPEMEVMSDDIITGVEVPVEETFNNENVDSEVDQEEQYPLLEDNVTNTNEADLPTIFEDNQMPIMPVGEPELEKIGTVIVLEAPDSPVDSFEPALENIHLDDSPLNQQNLPMDVPMMPFDSIIPESLMTPDSQPIIANEQIVPVAEYPEEGVLPINYWIPNNEDQHPIIFPEELSPRQNLPVFPENWNERDISSPDTDETLYTNFPPQYNEAPSYEAFSNGPASHGPSPPLQFTEEQTKSVFNYPNEEMPTKSLDFMTASDVPQMPREEVITIYENDNDNMFEQSGHIHIPSGFPQTFGYPSFRNRFNRPTSFGLPSMYDIAFQQDYHGPNTFPLNFRRPDFSSQMPSTYYNPYNDRVASFSNVNENMFSDPSVTNQDFRQGSNLGNIPKAFPSTQNMFLSMLNEPVKMIQDTDEQNMNLGNFQNSPTLMGSDRFNQQEQQYDVQVSIIPFESSYNVPSYTQNRPQEIGYPYNQQSNDYDSYQGFSYNLPAYGGSNLYNRAGIYSSPSIPSRYDMSYTFGNQNGNDRRFNYPVPTW